MPLPSSAQNFFTRVFEKARHDPDAYTLKPLYSMLNGACRDLLGLLDTQRRDDFDQELSRILSSNGAAKNYMLMLWCFGIVLLAENASETVEQQRLRSSRGVTPTASKKHWTTASGRKMFGDNGKISKTISLTYLSVIFATKGEEDVPDEDAVEGIQIAIRTLQHVDLAVLREWPRSSSLAKGTFTKLPDKILRSNINPAIQLEALCLYSMVAGEGKLSSDIVAQYERCLTTVADLAHSDRFGQTLSVSLPVYSVSIFAHSVMMFLTVPATMAGRLCSVVARQDFGLVCSKRRVSLFGQLHNSRRKDHNRVTQLRLSSEHDSICSNF
jgi:hypothetical protein